MQTMRHNIALLILLLLSSTAMAQRYISEEKLEALKKIQLAESAITALYVDSIADSQLADEAIRGMLKNLDPHSSYADAKETQRMTEPLNGSFEGIGVTFNMVQDTLLVERTITDGPSEKVGIIAGDRIVAVNDTAIAGVKMTTDEIRRRLRGKKGTKVNVDVVRRGIADRLKFPITRDKIPLNSIDAYYMVDDSIGYILLNGFGANTYEEFSNAIKSLRKQGMRHLMLDLQNNGGGYLQVAVMIANEFLNPDDLIVYTEGRAEPRRDYKATQRGSMEEGRVAVLINEYSASSSEIVAGALQDNDRAVVVGRRSFGKGLVQKPISFPDGSMMRLTIAHYYTPSGRCIQKPYVKGESEDYANDIEKRFKHGELYHADSIHFADSLRFETLKLHRPVYGGGGIMPDVFVPLDTTQYTAFHRKLAARGLIISSALKYMDGRRDKIKADYRDIDYFKQHYTVPQSLTDSLLAEAKRLNIEAKDSTEIAQSLPQINLQLKAFVARSVFDVNAYFQIINDDNHIFCQAREALMSRKF